LEWKHWVDGLGSRLLRTLLPVRCLLCGGSGAAERDLCGGCQADLPRNHTCCARCALPLAHAAAQCGECLRREPAYSRAWAPFRYAHPLDLLEARFKFRRDLAAGRVLAELLVESASRNPSLQRPQRLLCVPLHASRLRERGFNQALELARPLARALGIPLDTRLLQRTRHTAAQTGLDAGERRRNLNGAFAVGRVDSVPAHVAILDDVMTTGSTLNECARVLRRAGVVRVDVWALARAPARP
jgi:ComF family protein